MLDRADLPGDLASWGAALLAACLLAGYLLAAEPFVGALLHRRFERAARHHDDARRWLFRRLLLLEWGLGALCFATAVVSSDVGVAAIGIRLPGSAVAWVITAVLCALAALALIATARSSRDLQPSDVVAAGGEHVVLMLPRTAIERRLFGIVAVTAGICEEIVFRGFLITFAATLIPSAPIWVCAVAAVIVFALAHAYQGASGVILSLVLGGVLAAAYLITGSLIAPIVMHALIDLRAIPLGLVLDRQSPEGVPHA